MQVRGVRGVSGRSVGRSVRCSTGRLHFDWPRDNLLLRLGTFHFVQAQISQSSLTDFGWAMIAMKPPPLPERVLPCPRARFAMIYCHLGGLEGRSILIRHGVAVVTTARGLE